MSTRIKPYFVGYQVQVAAIILVLCSLTSCATHQAKLIEPGDVLVSSVRPVPTGEPSGWLFGTQEILQLTNSQECRYVHISLIQLSNDPKNISIVLSGVDKNYKHLFLNSTSVVSGAFPCPDCCNTNSDPEMPDATTYSASTPYNPNSNADHSRRETQIIRTAIPLTTDVGVAMEQIKLYIQNHPNAMKGWLVRKDELVDMINGQPYLHFIRATRNTRETLIIIAADEIYNHVYLGQSNGYNVPCVLESIYPCPECIDDINRPHFMYKVNDTLRDPILVN